MAGRPKKGENNLDLQRIIGAAWGLVDREGLDSLSTRALAAELNVKGPALYWHVRDKQQLLSLMLEQALGEAIVSPPSELPWWEWLKAVIREQRRTLLAHRDSGLIASRAPPTERLRDEIFPHAMEPLMQAGFSKSEAAAAFGASASLVLGTVIYEQDPATRAFLLTFHDPEEGFEFAIDAYVRGLREKLTEKRRPTRARKN